MKNKLIICLILLFLSLNSYALNRSNITTSCNRFELALANSDGTKTNVACYETYNEAKEAMNNNPSDDTIIIYNASTPYVYDSKYAILYLDRGEVLTYIYSSTTSSSAYTYMNNAAAYGGTDAAFIKFDYETKRSQVRIAGYTGWIDKSDYKMIPLNWVKSTAYYKNTSNGYRHYYAKDIEKDDYTVLSRLLGPKLSFFESSNKYYSYDGNYFYDSLKTMLKDYKDGTKEHSVNYENPYYNYYQYLPHRTKTNYTVDDIDSYIRNTLGFDGTPYGRKYSETRSQLFTTADYFINAEKLYGANALSVLSLSRNESGNGQSTISLMKNNIFGHNAVDSSPYSSATGYLDIRASIYTHSYGYINYGYSDVTDSRYYGGHFGNKAKGMNVKYASDPYWAEKAVSYYYSFDKDNGLLDYNYYVLGLTKESELNVRKEPNTTSTKLYKYSRMNTPVTIIGSVEGENVNGSTLWYKIQSEQNLNSSRTATVNSSSSWPKYNWDGYAYVHSSYIKLINNKDNINYKDPNKLNNEPVYTMEYKTYATNSKFTPIVCKLESDTDYYYTSSLLTKRGTALKGSYLTILEEAKNKDKTVYLVIINYKTYQRAWIDAKNTRLVDKDLLGYISSAEGAKLDIYDKINGEDVGNIYTGNYVPIVDADSNKEPQWLKVQYLVNPITYGYVKVSNNFTYSTNYLNKDPIITASNKTIMINSKESLLKDITGYDNEDGDITENIIIKDNNVDVTKPGTYNITYSLTDSFGSEVTKKINVTVLDYTNKNSLFIYNDLVYVEENIFNFSGFIAVRDMDNKEVNQLIKFKNLNDNTEYTFDLTKWEEYPYDVTGFDDTKTRDYSGAWFNTNIDLSTLKQGDYNIYVECYNSKYKTESYFTNLSYSNMERRVEYNNRGYSFELDYVTKNTPILLSIRDNKLISLDKPTTFDKMYNYFTEINLNNKELYIKGTSHSYNMNLSKNNEVNRYLILEEVNTFKRYKFDLGYIENGEYEINLPVTDNCDKTRAWYEKTINLNNVDKGHYAIYIETISDNKDLYGELMDIAYTDFSKINNSNINITRNNNLRMRLELEVK